MYIHHAGELGGAPKSLSIILDELDRSRFKPTVFMLINGPAKELFLKSGTKVITSSKRLFAFHGTTVSGMSFRLFSKNILYILPNMLTAYKVIKKANPQLIHLNTSCLFVYAITAKLFFKNVKVVSHIREPLLKNLFGKILQFFNRISVDHFIAINDYEASFFNKINTSIIKNSVNLEEYKSNSLIKEEERKKIGLKTSDFIVGFFARFNIENGIEDILEIAKKLEDNNVKFLIYGYAPNLLDNKIKSIAKEMPNNVILKGMVNDVAIKMQMIDVLISPFKTPHFSRSIIEAQSLSIPVLATNVKSQNTLLKDGDTGYLYSFGNIEDAVSKLILMKNDIEKLREMKKNSRKLAKKNYCQTLNNNRTFEIYEKLLKNDKSSF
ncbi:glycosyltransferase [Polaribacter sp. WD7]|uniref:glycosyltransferase n=1 Tax=Polaribacter sp. WD7 TaxID=2269061 RepID=UPI000DF3E95F|nr:glycosyltransferase [Polaribacter sp. WD7]RCS26236.1 glycosyltransferase [Polaribacter sp. WD7]